MPNPTRPPLAEPRRFVITLPLPHKACSPNARGHHMMRHRFTSDYLRICTSLVKEAMREQGITGPLSAPVRVSAEYYLHRFNSRTHPLQYLTYTEDRFYPKDEDNAIGGTKQAQDSLKRAGLISEDSAAHVHIERPRLYTTPEEHQGRAALVLTIEEVTEQ